MARSHAAGDGVSPDPLVVDLAVAVLERAAPEELAILPETIEDYYADPDSTVRGHGAEEELGFGLELAMITPYVLAVAVPVVQYLLGLAGEVLKDEIKPDAARWVRRVLRRPEPETSPGDAGPPAALSADQVRTVRQIAYNRARGLGISEDQATVLADAVAGGVLLRG